MEENIEIGYINHEEGDFLVLFGTYYGKEIKAISSKALLFESEERKKAEEALVEEGKKCSKMEHENIETFLRVWWQSTENKKIFHLIFEAKSPVLDFESFLRDITVCTKEQVLEFTIELVGGLRYLADNYEVEPDKINVFVYNEEDKYHCKIAYIGVNSSNNWETIFACIEDHFGVEVRTNKHPDQKIQFWQLLGMWQNIIIDNLPLKFEYFLKVWQRKDVESFRFFLEKFVEKSAEEELAKALAVLTLQENEENVVAQFLLGQCSYFGKGTELDKKKAVEFYSFCANKGYSPAQYLLARCYHKQEGVEADKNKEMEWLKAAAESGLSSAQSYLGNMYSCGEAGEENVERGVQLLTTAAKKGESIAQYNLATYWYCDAVPADMNKAVYWYSLSAYQIDREASSHAQLALAQIYDNGTGVEKDLKKAFELYTLASNQGCAHSQYCMGDMYQGGEGVEVDLEKAVEFYGLSATKGNPQGQIRLACCYESGIGVEEDIDKAFELAMLSAKQGNAEAQNFVGECYRKGNAVDLNWKKAVKWYRLSAKQEFPNAQTALGLCYEKGRGVEENIDKAIELYKLSAAQGYPNAHYYLARCYIFCKGKQKQEQKKIVEHLTIAAEKGHSNAQFVLGQCYYLGNIEEGKGMDLQTAMKWYTKSAKQGNCKSEYRLAIIYAYEESMKDLKKSVEYALFALDKGSFISESKAHLRTILAKRMDLLRITSAVAKSKKSTTFLLNHPNQYCVKMIYNFPGWSSRTISKKFTNEVKILKRLGPHINIHRILMSFIGFPTAKMMNLILKDVPSVDESMKSFLGVWDLKRNRFVPHVSQFLIMDYHPFTLVYLLEKQKQQKNLEFSYIVDYCLQLVEVFMLLMQDRIIHNNVTLENIYISVDNDIVLSDFGDAFYVDENYRRKSKNLKIGNARFTAPDIHDQVNFKEKWVNYSGQYSWEVGCLIYCLAFGEFPFKYYPSFDNESGLVLIPELEFGAHEYPDTFIDLITQLLMAEAEYRMPLVTAFSILESLEELE